MFSDVSVLLLTGESEDTCPGPVGACPVQILSGGGRDRIHPVLVLSARG